MKIPAIGKDELHAVHTPPLSAPPESLKAINLSLQQGLPGTLQDSKLWFFGSRCLVLDMEWHGGKVAVDMVVTDDEDIIVKMHARSADGHAVLEKVLTRTGCVSRNGKYLIARVPLDPDYSATGLAILGILNNLHARGQGP